MKRVLIACETSGATRRAFQEAGFFTVSVDLLLARDIADHYNPVTGGHIVGDIFTVFERLGMDFDLMIAHPDCTYLTTSAEWCYRDVQTKRMTKGVLYGSARRQAREESLEFVRKLMSLPVKRIAIENPRGVISTRIDAKQYGFTTSKATQYIQPYQFGHDASKTTGLWLKNLPELVVNPGDYVEPRWVCCGSVVTDKYGCPNCEGEYKPLPRWGNQTDSGQNKLGPSADRWMIRADTYDGWSRAMVQQWGSLL